VNNHLIECLTSFVLFPPKIYELHIIYIGIVQDVSVVSISSISCINICLSFHRRENVPLLYRQVSVLCFTLIPFISAHNQASKQESKQGFIAIATVNEIGFSFVMCICLSDLYASGYLEIMPHEMHSYHLCEVHFFVYFFRKYTRNGYVWNTFHCTETF
jgi:hypothetical protein